jgi:hypothetical protein
MPWDRGWKGSIIVVLGQIDPLASQVGRLNDILSLLATIWYCCQAMETTIRREGSLPTGTKTKSAA